MRKYLLLLIVFTALWQAISAQEQHVLKSGFIAETDTVWVFVPSAYEATSTAELPVLYMLHGWSGNYHQWNDIIDCQAYADRYSCIIVCPDGLYDSWYINSPVNEKSRYADFFFMDLMPFIANTYRVSHENIFITGLSMGGHGALYLFSQKPELFKSAGSLSGVVDLSNCKAEYGINKYLGLRNDKTDEQMLKTFSVTGNIDKIAGSGKEIIFSCGSTDRFYTINNEFKIKCDEYKIKATYISGPGAHDYAYWRSAAACHFEFFFNRIQPR